MPTYRLIKKGETVNIIDASEQYIDTIRDQFDSVEEVLAPPAAEREPSPAPEPLPTLPLSVSPVEFKLLFTPEERIAIKAARATDPVIDDFYSIIEDPRLSSVNLGLQSTIDGLSYLVSKNLITSARKAEILAGTFK